MSDSGMLEVLQELHDGADEYSSQPVQNNCLISGSVKKVIHQ